MNTQKSMFSLDDSQESPELPKRKVTTQKSMFSLNDSFDSEYEILDISLNYNGGENSKKSRENDETEGMPLKRLFPGPAGLLPVQYKSRNLHMFADEEGDAEDSTEQEADPYLECSQENADDNRVWIKALDDLGMQWGAPDSLVSKYNVEHIKLNAKPGSSIRMPLLVVRIKSLDTSCRDPVCRLRDPHGEVGGSIHRDVIEKFGEEIQVGSILVLRNVIVLMTASCQYVNITYNNMASIYCRDTVAHIHRVELEGMEATARQLEFVRREQLRDIQGVPEVK